MEKKQSIKGIPMKKLSFYSSIVLAMAAAMPLHSFAACAPVSKSLLSGMYSADQWSTPLGAGDYTFAGAHASGTAFFEELTFSLAAPADINIALSDMVAPTSMSADANSWFATQLSDKYLTFSLFDKNGHLLGSAGAGDTLTALHLASNDDYVLTVSGKAVGALGGLYTGNLSVVPISAVPLGDTAPLFGAALMVLFLRSRKTSAIAR